VKTCFARGVPALVLAALIGAVGAAQSIPPEAQKYIDAARAAAGSDHMGLFF
jgi:hypothetical protein